MLLVHSSILYCAVCGYYFTIVILQALKHWTWERIEQFTVAGLMKYLFYVTFIYLNTI